METFKKFVLSWKMCLLIMLASFAVGTAQLAVADSRAKRATVTELACKVIDYDGSRYIALVLDCGGHELRETTTEVVVSHLKNPGPLMCKIARGVSGRMVLRECAVR